MSQHDFKELIPVRHDNQWKTPDDVYAKHDDEWKLVSEAWINRDGKWERMTLNSIDSGITSWEEFCDQLASDINQSNISGISAIADGTTVELTGSTEEEFITISRISNKITPLWEIESRNTESDLKYLLSTKKIATAKTVVYNTQNVEGDIPGKRARAVLEFIPDKNLPVEKENGYTEHASISKLVIDGIDYISYPDSSCPMGQSPFTEYMYPSNLEEAEVLTGNLETLINSTVTTPRNFTARAQGNMLIIEANEGAWANGIKVSTRVITWEAKYNTGAMSYDCRYLGGTTDVVVKPDVFEGGVDSANEVFKPQKTKIEFGGVFDNKYKIDVSIRGFTLVYGI